MVIKEIMEMLSKIINDTLVFCEFTNEVGSKKIIICESIKESDEKTKIEKDRGWNLTFAYHNQDVAYFLLWGFNYIKDKVCDEENPPNCGDVIYYGYVCGSLINLMQKHEIEWSDLDKDGELYIGLNILANNDKKCILMNTEKGII